MEERFEVLLKELDLIPEAGLLQMKSNVMQQDTSDPEALADALIVVSAIETQLHMLKLGKKVQPYVEELDE